MRVGVIGAGVSGLSSALALAEAGHRVTVIRLPANTTNRITSYAAAAFWYPFRSYVLDPDHRMATWTYEYFLKLAHDDREASLAGVTLVPGVEFFAQATAESPDKDVEKWIDGPEDIFWWRHLPGIEFQRIPVADLPKPTSLARFIAGVSFRVPVIKMSVYLSRICSRLEREFGVQWRFTEVARLKNLIEEREFDAIVNCGGVEAEDYLPTEQQVHPDSGRFRPAHGQIVCIPAAMRAWRPRITLVQTGPYENIPLYVVPRPIGPNPDIVLGGTYTRQTRERFEHRFPEPDAAVEEDIIRRCCELVPELGTPSVLRQLATSRSTGWRPVRLPARIERDLSFDIPVVHNYGHGGAGVTFSWGCARRVANLLEPSGVHSAESMS